MFIDLIIKNDNYMKNEKKLLIKLQSKSEKDKFSSMKKKNN